MLDIAGRGVLKGGLFPLRVRKKCSLDSVGGGELVAGMLATQRSEGEKDTCQACRLEKAGGSCRARLAAHAGKGLQPAARGCCGPQPGSAVPTLAAVPHPPRVLSLKSLRPYREELTAHLRPPSWSPYQRCWMIGFARRGLGGAAIPVP